MQKVNFLKKINQPYKREPYNAWNANINELPSMSFECIEAYCEVEALTQTSLDSFSLIEYIRNLDKHNLTRGNFNERV